MAGRLCRADIDAIMKGISRDHPIIAAMVVEAGLDSELLSIIGAEGLITSSYLPSRDREASHLRCQEEERRSASKHMMHRIGRSREASRLSGN